MELRREVFLTIGVLVFLNLVLAFGAIGLFVRMGPAIEKILQENVYSIVAAEEILVVLVKSGDADLSTKDQQRVWQALEKAKKNVTEAGEAPVLNTIEQQLRAVFQGDYKERPSLTENIKTLITINRDAMKRVDHAAQRLGIAGAWASVFIGFFSFTLSLFAFRRLQSRFLAPMVELHEVLEAYRKGEKLRRSKLGDSPKEVRQVIEAINTLLDERLRANGQVEQTSKVHVEHSALLALLERESKAVVILDQGKQILGANNKALNLLAAPDGPKFKQAFAELSLGGALSTPLVDGQPLRNGVGWLCSLAEGRPSPVKGTPESPE